MRRYRAALRYADWSVAEWRSLLTAVACGRIASGSDVPRIAESFQSLFDVLAAFPVDSGSSAIRMALRLAKISHPAKTRVLVPAYICPSVVRSVREEGCEAIPVDVSDDLNVDPAELRRKISPDCLAVIVAHMYGCAADIDAIAACCRDARIPLIDDAAQVVGVTVNGRALGTFGEFGIVSFAQSKTIVTGVRRSGGLFLINEPALLPAARKLTAGLQAPQGRLVQLLYFVLSMQLPAALRMASSRYDRLIDLLFAPPTGDRPAWISNLEAGIALRQLERLPDLMRARIGATERMAEKLRGVPGLKFPQVAPARFLTRLLIVLPPGADRAEVRIRLTRSGIQTRLPYRAMFTQAEAPIAWDLIARMLELPCHGGLDERTMDLIRHGLVTALAESSDIVMRRPTPTARPV